MSDWVLEVPQNWFHAPQVWTESNEPTVIHGELAQAGPPASEGFTSHLQSELFQRWPLGTHKLLMGLLCKLRFRNYCFKQWLLSFYRQEKISFKCLSLKENHYNHDKPEVANWWPELKLLLFFLSAVCFSVEFYACTQGVHALFHGTVHSFLACHTFRIPA